jgi:small-conductance mechanosensitive channel/CRP-like cAMP-binding protein
MLNELVRDPLVQAGVLAVAGVVITRILLRKYPTWRLLVQFVFLVALTTLLLHAHIIPWEVAPEDTPVIERVFIALAKIVWWVNAAWLLTGGARVFLILERRPRESRLMQDLIVGVIYVSAALSIVAYVFSAPVGTLIATSGVFAIILGLALQSTLSDVFSGIALNLSKPYEVGDWIVLGDGSEGLVIETNWRATHLLNGSNDLVVLPNSSLAKARLTNMSSPNRSHGVKLRIRVMPTMAPSAIDKIMRTVLLSSNSIMLSPAPTTEIKSLDAQAIEFELSFRVRDFSIASAARHEVYDLIYRHARAAGLALAQPKEAAATASVQAAVGAVAAPRATALRILDAVPLFASLTEDEKATLAPAMTRRTYRKGEVLAEQGAKLSSLLVVRTGVLVVSRKAGADEVELSRLSPGDYFGEGGLFTGSGEPGEIRAMTFVVIYEVGQAALAELMHDRPSIADEIAVTLSQRAKVGTSGATSDHRVADASTVSALVSRIRQIFSEVPRRSSIW